MHPVLFTAAGFEVRSYGVFLALGIISGILLTEKELARKNLPRGLMIEMAPWAVLSGIVFSRLVFVATHLEYFSGAPLLAFNLRAGGLNFFGGFAGGAAAAAVFIKRKKIPFLKLAACASPGIAGALFIGRLGCFLNGCCYGEPSSLPWAVTYLSPRSSAPLNIPLHPSQIYEAAGNLLIFAFLWGFRRKAFLEDDSFFYFLAIYPGLRIFLERFRGDTLALVSAGFAWTDAFFAVIIIIAVSFILKKRGADDREAPGREQSAPKKHKTESGFFQKD